jgi:hypothetical protein
MAPITRSEVAAERERMQRQTGEGFAAPPSRDHSRSLAISILAGAASYCDQRASETWLGR